jgi:putative ABC transport system permease protein
VVLGLLGGASGLAVAVWATRALVTLGPEGIPGLESIGVDGLVLAFTLGVALAASTLAGVAPALRSTESALSGTLRGGGRGAGGSATSNRLRSGLVVGQMALAVILLIGAGLLLRSFARLIAVDPGFQTERVLGFRVNLPAASYGGQAVQSFYERLQEQLRKSPHIETVGAVSRIPIAQGSIASRFSVDGRANPGDEQPSIGVRSITPGYFRTLGIPLLRGRSIEEQDRSASVPVVVINQAAADRFFPGENPIGRRLGPFTYDPVEEAAESFTIVGVVADIRGRALDEVPVPEAFFAHAQVPSSAMVVVVRAAGDPSSLPVILRRELAMLDPGLPPPEFRTMERVVAESVARPRFIAMLLTLFAAVALALAAVGIFGLLSYTVAQRTREIGVRVALGARPGVIVLMIVYRTLILTGLGITIGVAGALALTRLLKSQLYGIGAGDPGTYAAVVLLLALIAIIAGLIPARRAMSVHPITALRQE